MASQQSKSSSRIDSLDGLRAVSIGWVIARHLVDSGNIAGTTLFARFAQYGTFGVRIFFVLSGFLITRLLLNEEKRYGKISLKHFYGRRFFRIFPPVLFVLAAIFLLDAVGFVNTWREEYLNCLFMVQNLFFKSDALAHFWSLSIEEQFYLLYPLFLLLVPSRYLRWTVLATIIAFTPRWIQWNLNHGIDSHPWRSDFNFVELAVGCLLASLYEADRARRVLSSRFAQSTGIFLLAAVALAATFRIDDWETDFGYMGVRAVLVGVMVNCLLTSRGRTLDKIFSCRPMVAVGKISFGLYLWQQIFCRIPTNYWFQALPYNVLMTLGLALVSYFAVEQPALRLRDSIAGLRRGAVATTVGSSTGAAPSGTVGIGRRSVPLAD